MPKNILVDLNVILDVLLERSGYEASRAILELGDHGDHRLYISAHAVTTFAYLLENAKVPRPQLQKHIAWLLQAFKVVPVNGQLLESALKSKITDYEDAVVEGAAMVCSATVIITRNVKDFRASTIPAITAEDYVTS